MGGFDRMSETSDMTVSEIAWEFAGVFDELDADQINEMLAKNVPTETLDFFTEYAEHFGTNEGIDGPTKQRLPNLMLIGYLLRVLEDRLL
jgi:hypothetical protein